MFAKLSEMFEDKQPGGSGWPGEFLALEDPSAGMGEENRVVTSAQSGVHIALR